MNRRQRRQRTLADLKSYGRDPFAIFRVDEALAIDGAWLSRVLEGAPLAFWGDDEEGDDKPEDPECPPYEIEGAVAVYDIEGPLVQRGWMCWPGYDTIARDLGVALADSRVKSVLLRMNSPGGMAAGCFEASRQMRDAVRASGKRVVAFADEMAYSAAYCLACVADEIVLPEPGGVGSVGVIASMQSVAKALAEAGVDVRVFTSGAEKGDGHPALPITKGASERTQARVDELAGIFQRWVAERRSMTPEAVKALEAGVRYGRTATASGLADRVMSYPELLAEMQRQAAAMAAPSTPNRPGAARPTTAARTSHAVATTTRTPMTPELAAALAATTGATDPDAQVAALTDLKSKYDAATGTIAKLSADVANATSRAQSAEQRAEAMERTAEIEAAKAARQWSPSLDGFLGSLSVEQLRSWRASAPAVVPEGEHKAPAETPRGGSNGAPSEAVAAAIAKAESKGWDALSGGEKSAVTRHSKSIADALRAKR